MDKFGKFLEYAIFGPAIVYLFMSLIVGNWHILEWHWGFRLAFVIWLMIVWRGLSNSKK